ncbi:MAG: DegT/DnrJ/EryC1/StrS family aminotransferase [Bacillota bacterium]
MDKLKNKIFVTKSFLPPLEEYIKVIDKVWESSWLTNKGNLHQKLETALIRYLDVKNISLFTNGHLALETGIKLLGLKGEVITTPFTFASTTHAIINCGLKPVFADIDRFTFNLDPNNLEQLITDKTSAIIPVHVFGNPCEVHAINEIAQKHGIKVIYDAAHAFGVEVDGKGIANYGDVSMFSFHATKVFHTIEGGALVFNNDNELKRRAELMKNFGISSPESVEMCGINAKMNEFQAAMGLINLRYIDGEIEKRRIITERYKENLRDVKGISFNKVSGSIKYNYAYFPVLIDPNQGVSRDKLHMELEKHNIYSRKYFYPLCSDFACYCSDFDSSETPVAKQVANNILTLPIYGTLSLEEVDVICEIIKSVMS